MLVEVLNNHGVVPGQQVVFDPVVPGGRADTTLGAHALHCHEKQPPPVTNRCSLGWQIWPGQSLQQTTRTGVASTAHNCKNSACDCDCDPGRPTTRRRSSPRRRAARPGARSRPTAAPAHGCPPAASRLRSAPADRARVGTHDHGQKSMITFLKKFAP